MNPPDKHAVNPTRLLRQTARAEGFKTVIELLAHYATDGIVPGVCVTCGAIEASCEPDAEDIHCKACDTPTVRSILVLAGVI